MLHNTLLLSVALYLVVVVVESTYTFVPLLRQVNQYELLYDLSNRITCHNQTDRFGFPLIMAADDFVIPPYESLNTMRGSGSDCDRLVFQFNTIRTKQDLDPASITLRLFYHNTSSESPNDAHFFSHTFSAPGNGGAWDTRLNIPITSTLTLTQGMVDDNGQTLFDMRDETFLPTGTTLWVSMYVSVQLHNLPSMSTSNSFFWVTLNNKTNSTPLVNPFRLGSSAITVRNYNYKYIDVANVKRHGLNQWTDATVVQPYLGIYTTTFNMAWSVSIYCNVPYSPLTTPPLQTPPPSSLQPSEQPTVAPVLNGSSAPTTEDEEEIKRPIPTAFNITDWINGGIDGRTFSEKMTIGVSCLLLTVVTCVLICVVVRVKRHRQKKKEEEEAEGGTTAEIVDLDEWANYMEDKSGRNDVPLAHFKSRTLDINTSDDPENKGKNRGGTSRSDNPMVTDGLEYVELSMSSSGSPNKPSWGGGGGNNAKKKRANYYDDDEERRKNPISFGHVKPTTTTKKNEVADWFNTVDSGKVHIQ